MNQPNGPHQPHRPGPHGPQGPYPTPFHGQPQHPTPFHGQHPTPYGGSYPTPYGGQHPTPYGGANPTPFAGQHPTPFAGQHPTPNQLENSQLLNSTRIRRVRTFGPYQLEKELGQGGFGMVWLAFDTRTQRTVALKILLKATEKSAARFQREVHATASLQHPHIVKVLDSGHVDGRPYMAMEFVEGKTLTQRAEGNALSVAQAVTLLRSVAEAIHYAHEEGVLHRDLKPDNILIDTQHHAHVLDFGLARLAESERHRLTASGAPMGTPFFMSPEQAHGRKVDRRTDVYGLGATLYFALTGRPPLSEGGSLSFFNVDELQPVDPRQYNPQVSPGLSAIVLRCLEKDPLDRFDSADEFAEALDAFLDGGQPTPLPSSRSPYLLPLAALATLTVLAAATLSALRTPTPTPELLEPEDTPPPPPPTDPHADQRAQLTDAIPELLELSLRLRGLPELQTRHAELRARAVALDDPELLRQLDRTWATVCFHRAQLGDAVQLADALLRHRPDDIELHWIRAYSLYKLGLQADALPSFQHVARNDPAGVYGATARFALDLLQGRTDRLVERHLDPIRPTHGDHVEFILAESFILTKQQPQAGLQLLERARRLAPDYFRILEAAAMTLANNDDSQGALAEFDMLLSLQEPRPLPLHLAQRGMVLGLHLERPRDALQDLDRALLLDPDLTDALTWRAFCLDTLGHYLRARRDLQRAEALQPGYVQTLIDQNDTYSGFNSRLRRSLQDDPWTFPDPEVTLTELPPPTLDTVAQRCAPADPAARRALSEALTRAAWGAPWNELAPLFQRAADLSPRDLTVAWETARIAVSRMQPHAERALDHALQLGADPAAVAFLRGLLASRQLDMSTARAAWSQAPQDGSRWADLCRVHLLDQSTPGSLTTHVLPLLERYPEDPHLVGLAAINLTYDRRPDEAIALTDRTLVLTSFLNYEPFLRGLAARVALTASAPSPDLDRLDQLLVQFNMIRAITRDPDARSSVATHLVRHNVRLGYADLLLGEALEVAPESADIWLMFSLLRIRQRRQQAALEGLRRARELRPNAGSFPSYIHDAFRSAFGDTSPLQALERS